MAANISSPYKTDPKAGDFVHNKKIFLLFAVGIFLAALSACSSVETVSENRSPDSDSVAASSEPPQPSASPQSGGTVLHLVSNPDGMLGRPGIGTNDGYYDVAVNADGSSNITFTDYSTACKIFLNSNLGSAQGTDADASWFQEGVSYLFFDSNKLYAVSQPNKIYCMEADGENRTLFAELPANQTMMRGVAADESGDFYTVLETTNSDGTAAGSLTKINADNGSTEPLTEIPAGDSMVGVFQDQFIFSSLESSGDSCVLYGLSVDSKEQRQLDRYPLESRKGFIWNSRYVYLDYDEKTIYALDLDTLTRNVLAKDLPLQDQRNRNNVRGIWGDYFVIRVSTFSENQEMQTLYAWSLSDGTMYKNNYRYDQSGTQHSAELLAASDGKYLLNCGRKAVTLTSSSADGTTQTIEDFAFTSALADTADFWNDTDNFVTIDDRTVS